MACTVPVIRWVPNTSSDKLCRCARCTACGHKGATLQHPGWVVPISASCRFLCTCSGPSSGGKAKSSTLYNGGRFHKQIGRAAMQHVFR